MVLLPRNVNLGLCLLPLSLQSQSHSPTPFPISPTALFSCQAAGITQMGLALTTVLIPNKEPCCDFSLLKGNILFFLLAFIETLETS